MLREFTARAILDSNFLVALIDEKDKWRKSAISIQTALNKKKARLVYLDCAVNETISVIARRLEEKGRSKEFTLALQKIEQAIPAENISWMYPEVRRLYPDILAVIKEHEGKLKFHDALMVLAAREMGISQFVSFDQDFDEVEGIERIGRP
jgi:predicted nucleic acid-binding protein